MPPKKITYPRYFRPVDPENRDRVIVFPSEGSMGTAYFTDLKRWASDAIWTLHDMSIPPVDEEIVRWQAVALGVPSKLPKFRAEPEEE